MKIIFLVSLCLQVTITWSLLSWWTPGNQPTTWKIFVKNGQGVFQISFNCFNQIFNLGICLFRCLCVNPYLFNSGISLFRCLWVNSYQSILFQSSVLRMVYLDVKAIWSQCLESFQLFIFLYVYLYKCNLLKIVLHGEIFIRAMHLKYILENKTVLNSISMSMAY